MDRRSSADRPATPQPSLGTARSTIVRPATSTDLPGIVRILNHYIARTHFTFDVAAHEVEERREWLESFDRAGARRLLVASLREGRIVGFASSKQLRAKSAYRRSVETTVYIDMDHVGRGVGERLYGNLLEELRREPRVHRAYGIIGLPNPASIALHEKLGFRFVGTLREVGYKFGRYWDTSWYEKDLSAPIRTRGETGGGEGGIL